MEPSQKYCGTDSKSKMDTSAAGHPVGVGLGAVGGGAAAGAVGGAVAGPVGVVIGATAGAVAGAMAGKAVAESFDPANEDKHWKDNFSGRPYVDSSSKYDDYAPAYRYGWESSGRHDTNSNWESVERDMGRGWDRVKGKSELTWDRAKDAVKDAWDRIRSGTHRASGSHRS